MAAHQVELPGADEYRKPDALELVKPTPMDLLGIALQKDAAIDVIERLAALQEKVLMRDAEISFNEALNRIQSKIKRIAPDLENPQTHSKYATYAKIDAIIRPIYSEEGMSLSFSHADCPKPDYIRVLCFASLGAYTRTYQIDMPADGKGAKGGDVMTKTHATAAADSYAKRYLVKDIFNIAIGENDTDGNPTNGELEERLEWIRNCSSLEELQSIFKDAWKHFLNSTAAQQQLIKAKDARKKELA